MNIYPSYTYLIGWSNHNLWYYGVRTGNRTRPEKDLWTRYFTSSKSVKKYRKILGEPDVVQVRRTFSNTNTAIKWELKVLQRLKVLKKEKWLNRAISGAIAPMYGPCHPRFGDTTPDSVKKKISEKARLRFINGERPNMDGKTHSLATKKKISLNRTGLTAGHKNPMFGKTHTTETKQKICHKIKESGGHGGSNNPMFGKNHNAQTRQILSEKNKGEQSSSFKGYYVTPWGKFCSASEASEMSPKTINNWTINRWCRKDTNKIVTKIGISKSNFLENKHLGKTFQEIGFTFIPV